MSNKIGANEPCPCGSGKKYKKCCMKTGVASLVSIATEDPSWFKLRKTEGSVFDGHLFPYAQRSLPDDVLKTAYKEFGPKKLPQGVSEDLLFDMLFLPWCMFNWIPNNDFGIKNFDSQVTLAENYLNSYRNKLTSREILFIEKMLHSYYSFYCVLDVEINKTLTVKDILLGTTHSLKERSGTHHLKRGDVVYGRILNMDDQSIFIGMAPYYLSPEFLNNFIDLRNALINMNDDEPLSGDVLRNDFGSLLLTCFFGILTKTFNKPRPTLVNTDDELIIFTKTCFELKMDPEEALACLMPLTFEVTMEELLEEAERDKDGNIVKITFSWQKKGNKQHKAWTNTILGNIVIEEGNLTLETNSQKRANLGRELLMKYLDGKIFFQSSVEETPSQKLQSSEQENDDDDEENYADLTELPEVDATIKAMAAAHWENWFDEPIPNLGNKTPRQAAKTTDGREKLEALLLLYENRSANSGTPFDADTDYLRKELHLESW